MLVFLSFRNRGWLTTRGWLTNGGSCGQLLDGWLLPDGCPNSSSAALNVQLATQGIFLSNKLIQRLRAVYVSSIIALFDLLI